MESVPVDWWPSIHFMPCWLCQQNFMISQNKETHTCLDGDMICTLIDVTTIGKFYSHMMTVMAVLVPNSCIMSTYMLWSWHGNAFLIAAVFPWGNSPVTSGFLSQNANKAGLRCCLCCETSCGIYSHIIGYLRHLDSPVMSLWWWQNLIEAKWVWNK